MKEKVNKLKVVNNNEDDVGTPAPSTQVIKVFITEYDYPEDDVHFFCGVPRLVLRNTFENVDGYSVNSDYLAIVQGGKTTIISKNLFDTLEITK